MIKILTMTNTKKKTKTITKAITMTKTKKMTKKVTRIMGKTVTKTRKHPVEEAQLNLDS